MKKIGIITTSCMKFGTYGCNYGAALQGYALVRQLRDMGYDANDINYCSKYQYNPQQYNMIKKTLIRISLLFRPKIVKGKIKEILMRKKLNQLKSSFSTFVGENKLTYNDGRFYSLEELHNESKDFFAFVTGSDVVWNPYLHCNINDPGYFLDFACDGVKRIAYAPSFGVTSLPDQSRENLKSLLEKFDAISVREQSGSDLIFKETGIKVPVVLDPTLLLAPQKYDDIEKKVEGLPQEYIAVYKFGNIEHTDEKIKEISDKLQLPIVFIPSGDNNSYYSRYDIGPGEFLNIINNAKLVLSDSFHCTVFCLIKHRPFLTFYRSSPNEKKNLNTRMISLLKTVGLSERLVEPGMDINYEDLFNIDFNHSDMLINKLREFSVSYLQNALEG